MALPSTPVAGENDAETQPAEALLSFPSRVVEACRRVVRSLARMPSCDREDVGQATAVKLLSRRTALERLTLSELAAYAWRVAETRTSSVNGAMRRRVRRERAWVGTLHVPVAQPERLLEDAEAMALVMAELARLPDAQRAAVVLCDLKGLTHVAAARALGVSARTVRRRHLKALSELQRSCR